MLRFEWNALRPGDDTLVHDPGSVDMGLVPGVVELVDTKPGDHGVGIRMSTGGSAGRIVWPSSLAVHLGPTVGTEPCWRCEAQQG